MTTINGTGEIEFGDHDLGKVKISDVKKMIQELYNDIKKEDQALWWNGYL